MIDLWINVILTIVVTLAVILADWVTGELITSRRNRTNIQRRADELIAQGASGDVVARELKGLASAKRVAPTWGSDLASIAFSLDFGILGIWLSTPSLRDLLPFFSRLSESGKPYEIEVWFVVIFGQLLLLLLSIFCKHSHTDAVEFQLISQSHQWWQRFWVYNNRYLLASNLIGFASLLSSFVIITNSI